MRRAPDPHTLATRVLHGGKASGVNEPVVTPLVQSATACSTMFSSSRTLPG